MKIKDEQHFIEVFGKALDARKAHGTKGCDEYKEFADPLKVYLEAQDGPMGMMKQMQLAQACQAVWLG